MPNPSDVIKTVLKSQTEQFVREHCVGAMDREVNHVLAEARKAILYEQGKQYLWPSIIDGQVVDWSATSGTVKYSKNEQSRQWYDYVVNHLRSLGRKFIAVLGKKPPNVVARPDNENDEEAVRVARQANNKAHELRAAWDAESIQRHLARNLFYLGTAFGYTPAVADGDRFGWVEVPVMEPREQSLGEASYRCIQCGQQTPATQVQPEAPACPNCGNSLHSYDLIEPPTVVVAEPVRTERYPRIGVDLILTDITTTVVPYYARDIRSCPWLLYEYEEHKSVLMATYPELRKLLHDESTGEVTSTSQHGRITRDLSTSPAVAYLTPRKDRWLYSRVWMTPQMYELFGEAEFRLSTGEPGGTQPMRVRDYYYQNFPAGVKLTIVQNRIVEAEEERLADVWTFCKPETSASIYCSPICSDILAIQDLINDVHNIMVETAERATPFMFFDPQLIDINSLVTKSGRPAEMIPAKPGVGQALSNSIVKGPTASVEPQIIQWVQSLIEFAQMNTGILPPIWGGDEGTQTAHEADMKRNQALMQLSTVWDGMRRFWRDAYQNAAKQLARYDQTEDLGELLTAKYHFEAEEAMPMTWGQRRDQINFYLEKGPDAIHFLGLDHPLSQSAIRETLGLPDVTLPMLSLRDSTLDAIRLLQQGQPVQQPDGSLFPSVPPDPSTQLYSPQDHMAVVDIVKEWCRTEDGRKVLETAPDGFQNVVALGMFHLMQAQPPGPPPGAEGGPPEGPPPPGGPAGPGVGPVPPAPMEAPPMGPPPPPM